MTDGIISDRDASRHFFIEVWGKHEQGLPMQPLEKLVFDVIQEHPEYHNLLDKEDAALEQDFTPEQGVTNPFLHMGMHITIREQVSTDHPLGIKNIYDKGLQITQSMHSLEHKMMECLGEALWKAQRDNTLPDEALYLECLKRII